MYTDKSDKTWGIITGIIVLVFLIIAGSSFLGRDCDTCISGWETLKQEGPNFWISAVVLSLFAGAAAWAFFYFYKRQREFKPVKPLLIAFLAFLAIAYGKGCTDKANDAVTTEKGRIVKPLPDTNRIPAEEMLPKK